MTSQSRGLILTCNPGQPPAGKRWALVWAADPDAVPPVSDATTCLPTGWWCLGTAVVPDAATDPGWEPDALDLTWDELNVAATCRVRLDGRVALVLDVVDGDRHWRIWLPAVRPVDGWQKFAIYPGSDGQRVHLFVEDLVLG